MNSNRAPLAFLLPRYHLLIQHHLFRFNVVGTRSTRELPSGLGIAKEEACDREEKRKGWLGLVVCGGAEEMVAWPAEVGERERQGVRNI